MHQGNLSTVKWIMKTDACSPSVVKSPLLCNTPVSLYLTVLILHMYVCWSRWVKALSVNMNSCSEAVKVQWGHCSVYFAGQLFFLWASKPTRPSSSYFFFFSRLVLFSSSITDRKPGERACMKCNYAQTARVSKPVLMWK